MGEQKRIYKEWNDNPAAGQDKNGNHLIGFSSFSLIDYMPIIYLARSRKKSSWKFTKLKMEI